MFGLQDVLGLFQHGHELLAVVAVLGGVVGDDELMFRIDGNLHVVARCRLALLAEQPGIRVDRRELAIRRLL